MFAFKINYNDADTATDLFNGNISETYWKTSTDNKKRKYDYKYDDLNRLLQADYSKQGNTAFNSYLEHLWYDKNGNIQTLKRNGGMDTDGYQFANPIDNLTYLYDTDNKNQLLRVFDATANPQGFKDDNNGSSLITEKAQAPDYGYDANGNMIRDDNKGIKTITYNHLNLPTNITFVNGNFITYLYNAVGQKVNKTVQQSADFIIDKTDYLSGFQYFNEILRFFPHAEGYVNATKNKFDYDFDYVFNYTDHLGNIRLSYSKDINTNALKVIEENHYYPFGLKHTGYNSDVMLYVLEVAPLFKGQPELFTRKLKPKQSVDLPANNYKYNGKEYQDELGLNEYTYGFRDYDPAIGRWMNVDPLAEKYITTSPYVFVQNNPLSNREIDGRYFDEKNEKKAARIERRAEKRADKLEKRADKLTAKGKSTGDLRDRATELRSSAQDVRDMRNDSSNEYRYASVGSKEAKSLGIVGPSTLGTGQNSKGDNVVSMFTEKNIGNILHEGRHGGQNARREINAITQSSSVAAEVSAYRAQFSWDGKLNYMTHNFDQTTMLSRVLLNNRNVVPGTLININSMNQINTNMVLDIGQFYTDKSSRNLGTYVIPIYTAQ